MYLLGSTGFPGLPRCCGHPGVHPDVGGTTREGTKAAADGDLPLRAGANGRVD